MPAIAGFVLFVITGAIAFLPEDLERRLESWASGPSRSAHLVARSVTAPALAASGVRTAMDLIRERRPGLLGAVVWWTFDILVLWAMFHAFGTPPPLSVIWMCYFVGTLANLLPLPGGLGGVEGGMIGAFAAFGVSFDLSVLAVLSYRAISFWLPTIPGAIAYFQLRRTVAQWKSEQPALGPRLAADGARPGRCTAGLVSLTNKERAEPTRGTGAAGGCGRVQAGRYQRPAVIVSVVARPAASRTRNGKRSSACRWWRTEALSAAPARSSGQRARRRAPASGRRNETVSSPPRTLVRRSTRLPVASRARTSRR